MIRKDFDERVKNQDFNPEEVSVRELCDDIGSGFEIINDENREAFYPLLFGIEETIWLAYRDNALLKDSDAAQLLKKLRDSIFNDNAGFNELEKKIINKIKIILYFNCYNKRDVSLSFSCVLKSVKLHRSLGGSRGYFDFINEFFAKMEKKDE